MAEPVAESVASVAIRVNMPNDNKPASPASVASSSDGDDVVIQVSPTRPAKEVTNDKKETAAVKGEVKAVETKEDDPATVKQVSDDKKENITVASGEVKAEDTQKDEVEEEGVKITKSKEVVDSSEDTKVEPGQDITSNEGTASPVKDAESTDPVDGRRTQPQFSKEEDNKAHRFITRAHAGARDTSTPVFKNDEEIIKLTEMVSQLTHLLAAQGSGRETTARAIAYINGPDKLDAKAAINAAKRDRRHKNQRRTSGAPRGPRKPADTSDSSHEKVGEKPNSEPAASANGQASTQKNEGTSTATTSTSDENGHGPDSQASDGNEVKGAPSGQKKEVAAAQMNGDEVAQTTNGQGVDQVEKPKKRFGRGKWGGWSRRRNGNKKNDAGKADDGQGPAAKVVESTKEAVVSVDEQKEQPDSATVQVARAA